MIAVIPFLLSLAIGIGAMAFGVFDLWQVAGRFASSSENSALVARGIAGAIAIFVCGSFCWSLFSLAKPLITKTVPAKRQMNGLMLVFAPALSGLLCTLYLLISSAGMRAVHWVFFSSP